MKKWAGGFGTNLILGISMIMLLLALVVPGIIFGIFWKFALIAVAIFPGVYGFAALERSRAAVK